LLAYFKNKGESFLKTADTPPSWENYHRFTISLTTILYHKYKQG